MISFKGSFQLNKPLSKNHFQYLKDFSKTRRVRRDALMLSKLEDPIRENVGLPLGEDACYYVGAAQTGVTGSVIDYNDPPENQPSIWCKWAPDDDGDRIIWNGSMETHAHTEWIKYLITNFLEPWGYQLNGIVKWVGKEADVGKITVTNNQVEVISLAVFA